MSQLTNTSNGPGRPVANHVEQQPPRVKLLRDKQWAYLQKRYHITDRELEIAKFACQGLSNEHIAEKLTISHGTVKTHIRNIYRKTWVNNKISMLLRFVEDARGVPLEAEPR